MSSHNEWDPLEEVIVGNAERAARLGFEPGMSAWYPLASPEREFRGAPYRDAEVARAQLQLDGFAATLESRGIAVRRPEPVDHHSNLMTPDFAVGFEHASACPRDSLLVIGDDIIEAPMSWRGRSQEYRAYRPLVKAYFQQGARWSAAPKPQLLDETYEIPFTTEERPYDAREHPLLTEFEPCFDAACFLRLGRDIIWQPDLVSNEFGAEWLRRHLGPGYRLHRMEFGDHAPTHIDATLVALRPGLVMTNPARPVKYDALRLFRDNGWEVVEAPLPARSGAIEAVEVSHWLSMNVLSLDPNTVVVEAGEAPMIAFLEGHGFDVVPVEFEAVFQFGGSFHCCTLDIRRRGELLSYFPALDGHSVVATEHQHA